MNEQKPTSGSSWVWVRLGMVYVCFLLFIIAVGLRLVQLQVLPNKALDKLAHKQFQSQENKEVVRQALYDRNGREFAVNVRSVSLFAHPKKIRSKKRAARILAKHLPGSYAKWRKKLNTKRDFVWIKRKLDEKTGKRILKYKIRGIDGRTETKRVYPFGRLASNILGFSGMDGDGLAGLELSKNKSIKVAVDGATFSFDGRGSPAYIEKLHAQARPSGIYTTIDRTLQYLLEDELIRAAHKTKAKSVMGIIMDPYTGEILAMGQTPSFDPNQFSQSNPKTYASRPVSHLYEPGSTMKVLLAAEALERKVMKASTPIQCENGKYRIGRKTIREAEGHNFKLLPLSKVIQYSSNIGAVKIANKLGPTRVRGALQRFGLTNRTKVGLPAEARSTIPKKWSAIRLANVGFGQGISVTPLNMVRAFATFANGGYLVQPKLLRGIRNEIRRVLSAETSSEIRKMLRAVVEEKGGTGARARISGIEVAGKTGTAQKYVAGEGYQAGKYFSSFIGFLPADRPHLVIGVMVDEPEGRYYASEVATPLFKNVAERALKAIDKVPKRKFVPPKNVAPEPFKPRERIQVQRRKNLLIMPNLRGLSVREVVNLLGEDLRNAKWKGHGYLVEQHPKPGTAISKKSRVVLKFSLS